MDRYRPARNIHRVCTMRSKFLPAVRRNPQVFVVPWFSLCAMISPHVFLDVRVREAIEVRRADSNVV